MKVRFYVFLICLYFALHRHCVLSNRLVSLACLIRRFSSSRLLCRFLYCTANLDDQAQSLGSKADKVGDVASTAPRARTMTAVTETSSSSDADDHRDDGDEHAEVVDVEAPAPPPDDGGDKKDHSQNSTECAATAVGYCSGSDEDELGHDFELGEFDGRIIVPLPGVAVSASCDDDDDDHEAGATVNDGGDDNDDGETQPPQHMPPPELQRTAPNGCAICLSPYEADDVVTWASNSQCTHVFHHRCIVDWLMASGSKHLRRQRRNEHRFDEEVVNYAVDPVLKITHFPMLCPCCRQPFIVDDDDDELDLEKQQQQQQNASPQQGEHGEDEERRDSSQSHSTHENSTSNSETAVGVSAATSRVL